MSKKILIIGANSDVGVACAQLYREKGHHVILAGHKPQELPAGFEQLPLDVLNYSESQLQGIHPDIVLFTAGRLGENEQVLFTEHGKELLSVNFTALTGIASLFAQEFLEKGKGVIVGVSSVAADRGKGSSVMYSAAKAGWDAYLAGLRNYLYPKGIRVITVRPGYIATKMTAHLQLPGMLTANPEQVAAVIVRHSLGGQRNVVYVKAVWRPVMCVIRNIPEWLFKRLKL